MLSLSSRGRRNVLKSSGNSGETRPTSVRSASAPLPEASRAGRSWLPHEERPTASREISATRKVERPVCATGEVQGAQRLARVTASVNDMPAYRRSVANLVRCPGVVHVAVLVNAVEGVATAVVRRPDTEPDEIDCTPTADQIRVVIRVVDLGANVVGVGRVIGAREGKAVERAVIGPVHTASLAHFGVKVVRNPRREAAQVRS